MVKTLVQCHTDPMALKTQTQIHRHKQTHKHTHTQIDTQTHRHTHIVSTLSHIFLSNCCFWNAQSVSSPWAINTYSCFTRTRVAGRSSRGRRRMSNERDQPKARGSVSGTSEEGSERTAQSAKTNGSALGATSETSCSKQNAEAARRTRRLRRKNKAAAKQKAFHHGQTHPRTPARKEEDRRT